MESKPVVYVGRTDAGCCVRIAGRGTTKESQAAHEFISRALRGGATVFVDLSTCDYLDSTFLGCLVDLQRKFGKPSIGPAPFKVAADEEHANLLLAPTRLDKVLNLIAKPPVIIGDLLPLQPTGADAEDLMRHVLDCHRHLAGIESPQQPLFREIVEQLEKDLETHKIEGNS